MSKQANPYQFVEIVGWNATFYAATQDELTETLIEAENDPRFDLDAIQTDTHGYFTITRNDITNPEPTIIAIVKNENIYIQIHFHPRRVPNAWGNYLVLEPETK